MASDTYRLLISSFTCEAVTIVCLAVPYVRKTQMDAAQFTEKYMYVF